MNLNLVEAMSAQLKNRNQELVEMDEFKDEFLATTSHELRTPLQGVSGLAKILKEDDHGSLTEEQHHKIGLIASKMWCHWLITSNLVSKEWEVVVLLLIILLLVSIWKSYIKISVFNCVALESYK